MITNKIIKNISAICAMALLLFVTACNREEESYRATNVSLVGYNNTGENLLIKIDTISYPYNKYAYDENGNPSPDFAFPQNSSFDFNTAYLFYGGDVSKLILTGEKSGKVYLEQPIQKELTQSYGFTFVNGKNTFNPPAHDMSTNKLGFFRADDINNFPIDIMIHEKINKKNGETEVRNIYIVKNLKSWEWVYSDYIPPVLSKGDAIYNIELHYFKAGTKEPAFGGVLEDINDSTSKDRISIYRRHKDEPVGFPLEHDRGKVYSFILSMNEREWGIDKGFERIEQPH